MRSVWTRAWYLHAHFGEFSGKAHLADMHAHAWFDLAPALEQKNMNDVVRRSTTF